jgi:hypothetical protein
MPFIRTWLISNEFCPETRWLHQAGKEDRFRKPIVFTGAAGGVRGALERSAPKTFAIVTPY